MQRIVMVVSLVAGLAVTWLPNAASAQAAAPERGTFDSSDSGTDPAGTTCSFPVHFVQREFGFYRAYSDAAGNFVRVAIHIDYDASISANGHTLTERDTYTRTIFADGTMRDVGLTEHVSGPSGIVIRDAGQIAYSDTNETVSYVRGPHPFLLGGNFCTALS
jgi:hypothetical protein